MYNEDALKEIVLWTFVLENDTRKHGIKALISSKKASTRTMDKTSTQSC